MVIYTIPTSDCTPQTIVIGRRTTYDTLQVVFDLSYLAETYGSGAAVLVVKRSQDTTAYPATIAQDGNTLTWTITEVDTYYVGAGECELMWYVNNGLAKTIIYPVVVMRDILQTTEEPPDAYENWVESLTALGAETQQHALDAAQSASDAESAKVDAVTAKEAAEEAAERAETAIVHAPIIQGGYWYIWDNGQYVNTNVRAEGEKGDKGDTGEKGDTGNGIASITKTGTAGLVDTYTVTYTDDTTTTFTVTNGAKGDKGDTGATGNGIDSITKTGTSGNVDTYTITYTNGQTTTFTVTNGAVSSVAGKTGAVTLDANDVAFSDSGTYDDGTVGKELSNQKNAFNTNKDSLDEKIGIDSVYLTIQNGTYANHGNANACYTDEVPVNFGDVIQFNTNAPAPSGDQYRQQIVLLKSDKSNYTTLDWDISLNPYVIINTPVKYVVYNLGLVDGNLSGVQLRKAHFDGYSAWFEIRHQSNLVDTTKAEANFVPVLRNGSLGNFNNTSKIATLQKFPVNDARSMQLEYLDDIPEGYTLTWDVLLTNSSGVTVHDYALTGKEVVLTEYLKTFPTIADVAFDLTMSDTNGNTVDLRIATSGNCVRVQYFNDKYLENVYELLKPSLNREVFAFVANAGKIVYKDRPLFRSSGRCAWKINDSIGFKIGNASVVYIAKEKIFAACSSNDSITEDGETWIYLRVNRGILYDANTTEVSVVDMASTTRLTGNQYLLIAVWAGQFIGGLLYEKYLHDAYVSPATAFNSANLTYDIDISAKAIEFANCISNSDDTESFLFFTDPHTYSKYWISDKYVVADAERVQTVIQKYYNSTPTDFVLCGGDWLTADDSVVNAKYKLGIIGSSMDAMVTPYYPMLGNHDTNYCGDAKLDDGVLTNLLFRKWGKMYYTFEGSNTKFYIFDSQLDGVSTMSAYAWEQIAWFATALGQETNSHIAVGIHIWSDAGQTTAPLASNIASVIAAYNARTSVTLNGVTYNFSTATGHIEFVIAGHRHQDANYVIDNTVPVILTINAWANSVVSFDLVYADYTARTIDCIRVGTGANRRFSLDTGALVT